MGCRGRGVRCAPKKSKKRCPPSPASDFSHGRSFAWQEWIGGSLSGTRNGGAEQKRCQEEPALSQMVVDQVADEVFCWRPTMSAGRGVPLLRILLTNTRCFRRDFRAAGRLSFQNEYSDEL